MGKKHRRQRAAQGPEQRLEGVLKQAGAGWQQHGIALLALAAFVGIFYLDYLIGTRFILDDALRWYYPVVSNFCSAVAGGRFPFWSDAIQCGMPLYTDIQASFYYPPLWLLVPFTGNEGLPFLAYQWYIVMHIFMGGGFMYLFLSGHRLGPLASLLGAMVFCFSGFMSLHVIHVPMLQVHAWLPLQLILVEKCVAGRRAGHYALLGLVLLVAFFGGFPQVMLYNSMFLGGYWTYMAYRAAAQEFPGAPTAVWRSVGIEVLRAGGVYLAVLLLAAIQILPALEHWGLSQRERWGYERISDQSMPWHMLIHLMVPNFFGKFDGGESGLYFWGYDLSVHEAATYKCAPWQYHEFGAYAGQLAVIAFAGLAWSWKEMRRNVALFFLCGAVLSLWFIIGRYGGLFAVLYHAVPGVSMFRGPSRMGCVLDFCLAAGVGFFVSLVAAGCTERLRKGPLLVLGVYLVGLLWYSGWARVAFPKLREPILGGFAEMEGLVSLSICIGIAGCLWGLWRNAPGAMRSACWGGLIVLTFADLYHAYGHFHRGRQNPHAYYNHCPSGIDALKRAVEATGPMRFVQRGDGGGPSEYLWDQNAALMHEVLESPRGLTTFILRKYEKFQRLRNEEARLDIANVRMCSSLNRQRSEASLVVRTNCLDRAVFYSRIKAYDSDEAILHDLDSGAIDHRRTLAVLESEFGVPGSPLAFDPSNATTPVRVTRISPEHTRIGFTASHPGVVFLSRAFYPGWEATDSEGRSHRLIRAFVAFTGIVIPNRGRVEIDLRFRPGSFRAGAAISVATALIMLGIMVGLRRYRNNASVGIR